MSTSKEFLGFINLTPHQINVFDNENTQIAAFGSNGTARCATSTESNGVIGGIPFTRTEMGEVRGLPAKQNGVFIIVSRIICAACPDRDDLVIVDQTVRNDKGQIVGCKSFSINPNFVG